MRIELLYRIVSAVRGCLDIGQPPERTDCIFVYAGRQERKRYGLQLFREGYADSIVFSVARFEWRRFPELGLESDGGLRELVEATPPPKRHFFVHVSRGATRCFLAEKGRLGTLAEAAAISHLIEEQAIRSLLVVTSGFHLRRAVRAIEHFSSRRPPKLVPVAVPEDSDELGKPAARKARESTGVIVQECLKLLLYRVLLLWDLPARRA